MATKPQQQDTYILTRVNSPVSQYLPAWVCDLVVCALYVDSFPVQTAAIASLLDLIILTQSLQSHRSELTLVMAFHSFPFIVEYNGPFRNSQS